MGHENTTLELDIMIIKYKGVFDYDKLYKLINGYLLEQGYNVSEGYHKVKPPEIEFEIKGTKKVTEFIQYNVSVEFHLWAMKEVDVDEDGSKKKKMSGRFVITIKSNVVYDWQKRFEKTKNLKFLRDFIFRVILRRDIEFKYADNLYSTMLKLDNDIKTLLNMEMSGNVYEEKYG